jgi:hypothetical protein
MLTPGVKEPSHTLPAQGDVTHADWQILFVTWVVNTDARQRSGLRAVGERVPRFQIGVAKVGFQFQEARSLTVRRLTTLGHRSGVDRHTG